MSYCCFRGGKQNNEISVSPSPISMGCAGYMLENPAVINGSPSKVLINAKAGVEHVWISFCSKYWNNQQMWVNTLVFPQASTEATHMYRYIFPPYFLSGP